MVPQLGSQHNYILKLDDIKFQWGRPSEELWMMREPVGQSLAERDETRINHNRFRMNNTPP